jgi:hypothetical protein
MLLCFLHRQSRMMTFAGVSSEVPGSLAVTVTRDRSVHCGNSAAPLFRLLSVFWCDGDVLFCCSCLFIGPRPLTVVERGVGEGVRGPTLPPDSSVEETESPRSSLVRVDTSTHKDCLLDKYPSAPRRDLRLPRRPFTKAVPYVYMCFPKR